MALDDIGLKYGTDKASNEHDYLQVYERYLTREVPVTFLEVGWWTGASMRMWREWLHPEATVVGVDIDRKEPIESVHFRQADQTDSVALDEISNEFGPWDVIVDDASHISPFTVMTFESLWPHLRTGGLYIIEDLQVSYLEHWMGNPHPDRGLTVMQFLRKLADSVMHGHSGVLQEPAPKYLLDHLAFFPGLCVMQKRGET